MRMTRSFVKSLARFSFLTWMVVSLLTAGCVTAGISSKREPGVSQRFSRVYILGKPGDRSRPEDISRLGRLAVAVMNKLIEKRIAASVHVLEPQEVENPQEARREIQELKPDAVLSLTFDTAEVWVGSASMGGVAAERGTTAKGDARLTLPDSDQLVWSASFDYGRPGGPALDVIESCAERIVQQLIKDGVLATAG